MIAKSWQKGPAARTGGNDLPSRRSEPSAYASSKLRRDSLLADFAFRMLLMWACAVYPARDFQLATRHWRPAPVLRNAGNCLPSRGSDVPAFPYGLDVRPRRLPGSGFPPRGAPLAHARPLRGPAEMVPPSGLEPERPFGPGILSPMRLPIPPRGPQTHIPAQAPRP